MKSLKKHTRHILSLSLILQLASFALSSSAHAQDTSLSETEKAVFAFYSLTDQTPNFQRIIENTPDYKSETSMFEKQQIFDREIVHLKNSFENFVPKENYLKINTDIHLQLRTDSKTPTLNFKFTNSHATETPYFPYPYGDDWIAAIAKDLNKFTAMPLTKDQYQKIRALFEFRKIYDGELNIELRPLSASATQPLVIEDINQWPLITDIAFLEFVYLNPEEQKKESLISYKAPWYGEKLPAEKQNKNKD